MLVGVALMLASLGIARERELGTLEQLMVTPLCARQALAFDPARHPVERGRGGYLLMGAPQSGSPGLSDQHDDDLFLAQAPRMKRNGSWSGWQCRMCI